MLTLQLKMLNMNRKNEIRKILEDSIPLRTITKLSQDDNGNSIIISNKKHFDFDKSTKDIKTSDTIFINKNEIEFIGFKNRNLEPFVNNESAKRTFQKDLRLKVIESFVSLLNLLNKNGLKISLDELIEENLNFKFVFNREKMKDDINLLPTFKANQEQWKTQYTRIYKSIEFLDNVNFSKKYNLNEKDI
jgi:hypothetical protein